MSEESWNEEHFTTKENHFDDVPSSTAIDNILRLNQTNIMNLTLMADTKANIMITVSSIVFSVTLSNMDSEILKWPLTFLGVFSMIALIFAIIVILPKTGYPKTHDGDIDRKSPFYNPLFFGHFAHIPLDEFKSEYAQRLEKDSRTYDAVVGNIYGLGRVLATNKFKYLKLSYTSFLIGLVSAMSVFALGHFDINIISITETISNELTFTWEGVKVLLCKLSERC